MANLPGFSLGWSSKTLPSEDALAAAQEAPSSADISRAPRWTKRRTAPNPTATIKSTVVPCGLRRSNVIQAESVGKTDGRTNDQRRFANQSDLDDSALAQLATRWSKAFLQAWCSTKANRSSCGDLHFPVGSGIETIASFALADREGTETGKTKALMFVQRTRNVFESQLDCRADHALRLAHCCGNLFDKFGLSHRC